MDKFADGDPSNNDYFGSVYEWDWRETQLRYGGDLKGLVSKLDYIQGMGVKAIFISGTPFLNMLWQADSYSPLDFTVLDPHWGTLADWQATIDEIHARGMYIMADFTVGTMADLVGFQGFLNESTPFSLNEYDGVWKDPEMAPWGFNEYKDFQLDNTWNESCILPKFWGDDGTVQDIGWTSGCRESDLDQYGDMEAFGVHPDWQRQLAKFASVQDRLREWKPSVMSKLKVFSCLTITALDIDAIRIDKSTQVTVDALSEWASSTRACAASLGKTNFFIPGEVTGGDTFGSLYYGRGRTPTQLPPGFLAAAELKSTDNQFFLRDAPLNALDGAAFHYSIYRSLSRFLGMDGNLQVAFDVDTNFITAWNQMFVNNDFLNPSTGDLDPRHMFGTSNFDVFRWPSLENGTQMSVLGTFITNLVMPGIPLLYYGEEQNFYLYDTGASNYLYGPSSDVTMTGTLWTTSILPWTLRRTFAQFLYLRNTYNALQDGFNLVQRGNWTYYISRPGSNGTLTEMGLWSVSRSGIDGVQNLTGTHTTQVWMLYSNENQTRTWTYDCKGELWISSPYESGTTVRNLFYPYENYTLQDSGSSYFNNSQAPWYGCLNTISMAPYSFKALVPLDEWVPPPPALTKFLPGHDARINVESGDANATTVDISLEFNTPMDCTSVTNSISLNMSSSGNGSAPTISSVKCLTLTTADPPRIPGASVSEWSWSATLENFPDGILAITLTNPVSQTGVSTNATDRLLLRKGSSSNVMVFPNSDYDAESFTWSNGQYTFAHKALGADMFRVFTDSRNFWDGEHLMVQYWSATAMTSSVVVHADHNYNTPRRVPQFLARGPFNQWGFDKGISAQMTQNTDGKWELEIMATWPAYVQLNVFGYDNYYYGDTDGDGPHLAWALIVDDAQMTWSLEPRGESAVGAITYALLLSIPLITGALAVVIFMWSFYGIRYNKWGVKPTKDHSNYFPILGHLGNKSNSNLKESTPMSEKMFGHKHNTEIIGWPEDKNKRRTVLIATLEYEIIDWKLKVKIGGLGVMSSLMGKAMTDVDLIWVIPKVKDLEYPPGEPAEPIEVIIFGEPYLIEVETHVLDNITYVILDSPVFRAQTKADPYPARMDDLSSAIFYSTWNQAIAATVRRFPAIDIYHINDYHGALVGIYLLPKVLPVCLSLHNAEFQGLWPLRTKEEMKEVCSAFNISKEHCTKYVQFGNTFNLLHAAASFISVHQKSLGSVSRVVDSQACRLPPESCPTDIAALDENPVSVRDIKIDQVAEAERPEHKRQAQEWAGIKQDPNADLFVFVGRWSKQKGVDLIADVMPSLLEKRPSIQLITVGPVIDLYGRFAAEKLSRLMEMYPDRVYSKPEFTALPPYLFSGADFALIPSRDEPFGLVAVEFGRKGALGVGSRLGGLGLMPGWWFPVESTSTEHMMSQLTKTVKMALKSTEEERAMLRARSAVQRFPVVEWRQRMEDFHRRSITISRSVAGANAWRPSDGGSPGGHAIGEHEDWDPEDQAYPSQPDWDARSVNESPRISAPGSPGQWSQETLTPVESHLAAPRLLGPDDRRGSFSTDVSDNEGDYFAPNRPTSDARQDFGNFLERANRTIARDQKHVPDPFLDASAPTRPFGAHSRASSVESIASIVDEKQNSPLNKAIASFTDADGGVASEFVQKLQMLDAHNSKHELSIEKFLTKSEEAFFDKVKKDKLSSAASIRSSQRDSVWGTPVQSAFDYSRPSSPSGQSFAPSGVNGDYSGPLPNGNDVVIMTGLQIALSREIFGWPIYTIIIAIGQMLGATSFQITLLSGQNSETNLQLYVLGGVFLAASLVWYFLFRVKPSVYVLSAPWLFFGIAFFLIGLPSVASALRPAHVGLASAATWAYAIASAAAFLFFGLNFGEEAGAATEVWTTRACIVQGSQQIWVAALWYWGYALDGVAQNNMAPWWIVLIVWPLALMSLLFAYLMLYGLPDYYRQTPRRCQISSRRFSDENCLGDHDGNSNAAEQDAHLAVAGLRGRLGSSPMVPNAVGTSSLALYIPWAGHAGPYLGICLWLWLGVLDAIQGVGLGMILLQTLSRLHVCATLAFAQIIGSICVMVARATAPNRIGPESVFPDAASWDFQDGLKGSPLASAPFWVALICQIVIVIGYFWFYRKEQLARP
ncbi:Cell wall alpha-1,3-glucan synthase mok13 [Grifola frondosa]|uniref:alpha-1,3-glucan synthase n=1 Tax=Grifola frondosa TaxID=5627 RepID=A0A1C7MFK0_GRIFR|nr:Cell wall alpha-1,3-glucan synthase mok13 [Grifola frondosa]